MTDNRFPPELDRLLVRYRDNFSDLEASRNFMPGLWTKIDQRQRVTYSFRRLASGFVTAAAAICLVMSLVSWTPSHFQYSSGTTYVDVLADAGADSDIVQADSQ